MDGGGQIGLGTSTPVVEMHMVDGNTPTMRLEQDGSSGFSQQTWDVAGNEANFFIRDVSNGSKLPFRIFPNAPSDALTIEGGSGDIGLNTTSPTANLHVVETAASNSKILLKLQHNGNPEIELQSTDANYGSTWTLSAGSNFVFKDSSASPVVYIRPSGDILFKRRGVGETWVSLQEVVDTLENFSGVTLGSGWAY